MLLKLMRNVAAAVLNKDGILTDIKSYGDHPLAYTICRPGHRYDEVCYAPCCVTVPCQLNADAPLFAAHDCPNTIHTSQSLCAIDSTIQMLMLLAVQAFMWQVDFAAAPSVLDDLKHLLKVLAAGMSCSCMT